METLCILCLTMSNQVIYIFEDDGLRLNISNIITRYFRLTPSLKEANAKVICCSCWADLSALHKFCQKIEEAHAHLDNVKLTTEDDTIQIDNLDTCTETLSEGISVPINDDDACPVPDPLSEVLDIGLKTCESSGNDLPDSNIEKPVEQLDVENSDEIRVLEIESSPSVDSNKQENSSLENKSVTDDSQGKKRKELRKILRQTLTKKIVGPRGKCRQRSDAALDIKNTQIPLKNFDKIIKQNMDLSCNSCQFKVDTFLDLQRHCGTEHSQPAVVTCCDKTFETRHKLVNHILLHKEPDRFHCEIYSQNSTEKYSLKTHLETHLRNKEVFSCKKCEKNFNSNDRLNLHMETHVEKSQVCEHCGKMCSDKVALRQHNIVKHTNMKLQCSKCNKYYTNHLNLFNHMKFVHPKTKVSHVCSICGMKSTSSYGLKRHITYMHKSKRIYKCTVCKKGFKLAQALKEHMTTHTGEVLYTCPHCPKTFNSNANMHSHRKKMHRKEWEENRRHPHMGSSANAE